MPGDLNLRLRLTADGRGFVATVKGGEDALDGLRDSVRKIGDESGKTERKARGLGAAFRRMGRDLKTGISSFVIGGGILGAIQGALSGLSRGLQNMGRHIVDSGLRFETWNQRLLAAAGTADGAADAMTFLRRETDRLGLDLGASAHAFSGFAAAARGTALQGQAARDIFSGVAEAAAVMGLSAADAQGVFLALEQIVSKGTVSAEELRGQLGERLPGAFQAAARALGVTTSELDGMLRRGEVLAEDLLPLLAAELSETFGDALPDATASARSEFARLRNALLELGAAAAESGLLDWLGDVAGRAADAAGALAGAIRPDTPAQAGAAVAARYRAGIGRLVEETVGLQSRPNRHAAGTRPFARAEAVRAAGVLENQLAIRELAGRLTPEGARAALQGARRDTAVHLAAGPADRGGNSVRGRHCGRVLRDVRVRRQFLVLLAVAGVRHDREHTPPGGLGAAVRAVAHPGEAHDRGPRRGNAGAVVGDRHVRDGARRRRAGDDRRRDVRQHVPQHRGHPVRVGWSGAHLAVLPRALQHALAQRGRVRVGLRDPGHAGRRVGGLPLVGHGLVAVPGYPAVVVHRRPERQRLAHAHDGHPRRHPPGGHGRRAGHGDLHAEGPPAGGDAAVSAPARAWALPATSDAAWAAQPWNPPPGHARDGEADPSASPKPSLERIEAAADDERGAAEWPSPADVLREVLGWFPGA